MGPSPIPPYYIIVRDSVERKYARRAHRTRMARMGKLPVPHAMLAVSLPAGTCSLMMCPPHAPALYAMRSLSCGGHTRMTGRWSLPTPHAMLAANLPESACSLMICPTARAAGNSLASQHMLTQALPTAFAKGGTRMARMGKLSVPHAMLTVSLPAGTCSLMMCPPHAPALYAMRSLSCGARARLAEQRRLSAPHATLAAGFPESKCSPIPCLPRALSFRTAPFSSQVRGDRGRATPEWQNRKNCSFCTRCC